MALKEAESLGVQRGDASQEGKKCEQRPEGKAVQPYVEALFARWVFHKLIEG